MACHIPVEQVEDFDPDVVCASAYVWSLPTLVEVPRRLKANLPERTVVFEGPSARPSNLAPEPYAGCGDLIDALVLYEGEDDIREEVAAHDRGREALRVVRGLALPDGAGGIATPLRAPSDRY